MAELRVDPADVGPRIALALQAAATALAAPAAIAPPLPAGADPVSAAAAGRVATNAATLSGQLAGGISRLAQGAQAVTKALAGYVSTDAAGAARIDGHAAAAAAAETVAAIVIPSVPAIEVPSVPMDAAAAVASLPADPAVIDDALHAGPAESGLHAHASAWDAAAAQLHTAATEMRTLGATLPASWSGTTAENLTSRLGQFSDWLTSSADSARAHADTTRQAATMYRSAVNAHPRATDVRNTQQALLAAVRRAAAGDPTAVPVALDEEAKLAQMKEQSATAMSQYGQGAGGLSPAATPGDSPRIGDGDPHIPDKPADGVDAGDDSSGDDPEAALKDGQAVDDPQSLDGLSGGSSDQLSQTASQSMQQLLGTMTQMPSQMAQAVGQALNSSGQQLGQVGQQASQAVSQLGQVLGGSPLSASRSAASSAGLGDAAGGLADALGGAGGAAGDLGAGLGDLGAGAGDFGAGTVPAGLPEQLPPPAAASAAATEAAATTSMPRPVGPTTAGMAGGMPMGMMPMAGRGAGEAGKEMPRNPDWFPDEPLVKDEPEVSEAVAGQRRRPRPTQT